MRSRLQLCTLLFAWLLATGSHWDIVQTFAWGRMIARYTQTMPLDRAIVLTFTPDNLCSLCEVISQAKHQETPTTPEGRLTGKVLLVFQPIPVFVFTAPNQQSWFSRDRSLLSTEPEAPPVPPPRSLA